MFSRTYCTLRQIHTISRLRCTNQSSYKSQYSIDNLYPNRSVDYCSDTLLKNVESTEKEFKGYIPVEGLEISYCRSSGPGGQNVNKVNTKVEIRFHVQSAKWIPDSFKPKLIQMEAGRMTKDGYLIITSDKTRKQIMNQADCLDRLRTMIRDAAVKPYQQTQDNLDLIRARQEKARAAMLREKKSRSLKKQSRQGPSHTDV